MKFKNTMEIEKHFNDFKYDMEVHEAIEFLLNKLNNVPEAAYIECPHCNYKHEDWQNYGLDAEDMEGEFDMPCEKCGEKFTVKFHMTIHIETSK